MEKKVWSRPTVDVVAFAANDFCVSACTDVTTGKKLFDLVCNACFELPNLNFASHLFVEAGKGNNNNNVTSFNYNADSSSDWLTDFQESGSSNYETFYQNNHDYDQLLHSNYTPHNDGTVYKLTEDQTHSGWLALDFANYQFKERVTIWHDPDGSNIHAMLGTIGDQIKASHS